MEESSSFYRRIRIIQIHVLRYAGLVTFEKRTPYLATLASIYIHFCFSAISSVYIWVVIQDCLQEKFNPFIVSELFSFVGFHFRFMYVFSRRKKLGQMLKFVEDLWEGVKSEEKLHVRLFVRKVSRLGVMYSGIVLTTITMDVLSNQLPQWTADKEKNSSVHRNLPYPFFVDVQNSPNFEILLGVQVTCILTMTQVSIFVDTTIAFLIMIACGHFRLIQVHLRAIARDINEKQRSVNLDFIKSYTNHKSKSNICIEPEKTDFRIRERLRACIHQHQKILVFCDDIVKLSSEVFMIELISTTYNLSFIGILLAGSMPFTDKLKFAMVLFILTLQLFICQYPPEILLQESAGVADAAYFMPSFRRDKLRLDKLLITLITRSQVPVQLRAGGQIKLSIESFGNMIKAAVSFFTVLRKLNE